MKTFNIKNENNVFFTSDTHFGHRGILDFCDRKYNSVEEMNEGLISNWNSVVKKEDFVFHLGDFAFGGSELWVNTLKRLNGNIVLIKGNHDAKNYRETFDKFFVYTANELFITVGEQQILLNHYPLLTYAGIYRQNPVWQLFGHVHTCKTKKFNKGKDFERLKYLLPTQYDVGCDFNDCTPVSFDKIKQRINYQIENNVNITHWIE